MFGFNIETYEVTFEIYIDDKLVQSQTMQAMKEMIMMNFVQLAKQIRQDSRKMKLRLTRPEVIWDSFENKEKVLMHEITISNR